MLLSGTAQELLKEAGTHAYFHAAFDGVLYAVTSIERPEEQVRIGHGVVLDREHPLSHATQQLQGAFYRAPADAHNAQLAATWRSAGVTFDGLKTLIPALELAENALVITYVPDWEEKGVMPFACWRLQNGGATGVTVDVVPDDDDIAGLGPRWPIQALQSLHVLLVGAGTVGYTTALTLASFGVGRLTVVDPDRLRSHNLRRLPYGPQDVGQVKADLLAATIGRQWPHTRVDARVDDIVEDIDAYRQLAADADLVVCTADGVLARRVSNYLARRGGTDCVLGCVLDDGGVAEVLRLRATLTDGCLRCHRAQLAADGVLDISFDPEADLHRDYAEGMLHKPMTAAGGDLSLTGQLTAKVAVATLLHNAGHSEHVLPGEGLLLSLRGSDLTPPYGASTPLAATWLPAVPRQGGCFVCGAGAGRSLPTGTRAAA